MLAGLGAATPVSKWRLFRPSARTERERVIGFRLPYPGIGFVERTGSSYRSTPA